MIRPPLPVSAPVLTDGTVSLRMWRAEDAEQVYRACQDPEVKRWIPIPDPYTMDDAVGFIDESIRTWQEDSRASYAIVAADDEKRVLGAIALHATSPRRWYIGYWIAPEARGRGVATRSVVLLSGWAFEEFDIIRLSLYTLDGNVGSGRVAEKAGFVREGVLRLWDEHRGEPRDCVMFSLIRADLGG